MKRTKKFKVFPDLNNKYWYVQVVLAPNERAYLNQLAKHHYYAENSRAMFGPQTHWEYVGRKKKGKRLGGLGSIYLNAADLDGEIVSHECAHAAFEFCKRRKKTRFYRAWTRKDDETKHDQEVFCYAQGWMTDQILGTLCGMGFELSKNS